LYGFTEGWQKSSTQLKKNSPKSMLKLIGRILKNLKIKLKKNRKDLEGLQRLANLFQILKKDEITEQIRKHTEEIQALINTCNDAYQTALRNQGYMH
jgi:hypothetical protein